MKIALVTLYGVINSLGGSTKALCDMANLFDKNGHEVAVFFFDYKKGNILYRLNDRVLTKNCCSSAIDRYAHYDFLSKVLSTFSFGRNQRRIKRNKIEIQLKSKSIKKEIDDFCPDLIISFSQSATYLLVEELKLTVPIISSFHSDPKSYFERPEFDLFRSSLERAAAIHVLMSDYVCSVNKYLKAGNVVCISNVVQEFNCKANLINPKIVNVARVCSVKRQHLLIEAFALLHERYPEWSVDIWGGCSGDYARRIQTLIDKLNLTSVVNLNGETYNVIEKLQESSIFAFPSEREGFSIALGEAMSMGLPTVGCKDCYSVSSLIKNEISGLISDPSPNEFANALERLMRDKDLRIKLGRQAKVDVGQFFEDSVYQKWNNLFLMLMGK